ncbi:MAG: phosphoglucosamine mutase, partial [Bauldia litoralis]
ALQVLAMLTSTGRPASEAARLFEPVPQLLRNVRYSVNGAGQPLETDPVREAISDGEGRLGAAGRLVIRKSGTEPLIRVMAEGDDADLVEAVVGDICTAIEASAGQA